MIYRIWSEGFCASGDSGKAYLLCVSVGDTFEEACNKAFEDDKYYNKENRTYWGCKLFDNEYDARRSFG